MDIGHLVLLAISYFFQYAGIDMVHCCSLLQCLCICTVTLGHCIKLCSLGCVLLVTGSEAVGCDFSMLLSVAKFGFFILLILKFSWR